MKSIPSKQDFLPLCWMLSKMQTSRWKSSYDVGADARIHSVMLTVAGVTCGLAKWCRLMHIFSATLLGSFGVLFSAQFVTLYGSCTAELSSCLRRCLRSPNGPLQQGGPTRAWHAVALRSAGTTALSRRKSSCPRSASGHAPRASIHDAWPVCGTEMQSELTYVGGSVIVGSGA